MSSEEVLVRIEGRVGRITLNRPAALNSLTYGMVAAIDQALSDWRDDPAVALVMIDGQGEKAFCAGGDIQDLYRSGQRGDFAHGRRFWADEYRMNARIARFPKPYVAIMDGFVMGGGVGVSSHGSLRIVTERTQVGMPECAIGLVPDVGGSWLLARAPGRIGEYLGITGARLEAGDAIYCGFADVHVPSERLAELKSRLVETADPSVVEELAQNPPAGKIAASQIEIDRIFGRASLSEIETELVEESSEWSRQAVDGLIRACPLSAACTLEIIRQSRAFSTIEEALALEYRFSSRCMEAGNFLEGVRAALIDKDRKPAWSPARIEDVTPQQVSAMLAPAVGGDIIFS